MTTTPFTPDVAPGPVVRLTPHQAGYHAGLTEARAASQIPGQARPALWNRCPVTIPAGEGGLAEWLAGYAAGVLNS